jgi:hypothetical protein
MVDQNNSGYVGGRGLPFYLLDRANTEDTSSIPSGFFSLSESSVCGRPNTCSNIESNSFQFKRSGDMSFGYDEPDEARTIRSGNRLNLNSTYLMGTVQERVHEVSILSSLSLLNISADIPVCLTKDEHYNTSILSNDNYDSNGSVEPENMFPPYVRLFSDNESELEQKRQSNNNGGVFNIVNETVVSFAILDLTGSEKVKGDNGRDNSNRVEIILPKYNECCLWDNSCVSACGDTSHRKESFLSRPTNI